jgi:hypothetical protein
MQGNELIHLTDIEKMADSVIASKIFPGFNTRPQVMSLMLLCQAEGMHPMKATQLFDILPTGKVGIKSSALQAAFQARGGKIKWVLVSDDAVEAVFSSPGLLEPVTVRWTMADAAKAGLNTKQNWRTYPRQMLAARVTTDGINRADPGARFGGLYPTEVQADIDDEEVGRRRAKALFAGAPKGEQGTALGDAPAEAPEEPEPTEEDLESVFDVEITPESDGALSRQLLASIHEAKEAKEAPKRTPRLKDPEGPAPTVCPKCESEIGEFISNSKTYPGRKYLQCRWAYGQKRRLIDIGANNQEANGHVAEHYRAWKEAAAGAK